LGVDSCFLCLILYIPEEALGGFLFDLHGDGVDGLNSFAGGKWMRREIDG
jgi:hypothetical protein